MLLYLSLLTSALMLLLSVVLWAESYGLAVELTKYLFLALFGVLCMKGYGLLFGESNE